ncbi:MAG: hypothetical protein OEV74_04260 [Cyclobacteriaceae bacterium]|nr:hypothetical protein [Cyclobacteriaceae bacterium]MDH4295470.1 hypothetical protein [Cyclobacteriaceae bacterium]MDH5249532.1 hypothetical protein [Cyclobacteriaceae bacterium]
MRSIFLLMSQKLHFSEALTLNRLEYSLIRYGQLIVYLLAIGALGYCYISLQGMFADYLDGLALREPPNY